MGDLELDFEGRRKKVFPSSRILRRFNIFGLIGLTLGGPAASSTGEIEYEINTSDFINR